MIEKDKSYVYGSVAEKLEYDVYEENKVLKAKRQARSNKKAKTKLVFNIMVIFALCFILMYRYTLITEMNYAVNKADKDYSKIRNDNSTIMVDIEKKTDMTRIKEIAQEKLGMHKPDKYQIVYLSVPKDDFTVLSDTYKEEGKINNNMFAALLDKVSKFTQLLY